MNDLEKNDLEKRNEALRRRIEALGRMLKEQEIQRIKEEKRWEMSHHCFALTMLFLFLLTILHLCLMSK